MAEPRETPKCTSWLGHKFEPRYTEESKGGVFGKFGLFSEMTVTAKGIEATDLQPWSRRTYHGDVCVRCGTVVNQPKATP